MTIIGKNSSEVKDNVFAHKDILEERAEDIRYHRITVIFHKSC